MPEWKAGISAHLKNDSELGRHVAAKLSRVEVVVARDEKIKVGARSRQ